MNHFQKIILLIVYAILLQFISLHLAYSVGKTSRFSVFFDQESVTREFETHEAESYAASLTYLGWKKNLAPQWPLNSSVPNPFCITIVTKKRPNSNADYIIRSTAYLLSRLEAIQLMQGDVLPIKVFISNTERPSGNHKSLASICTFVDVVHLEDFVAGTTHSTNNFDTEIVSLSFNPSLRNLDSYHKWLRNEALDTGIMFDLAEQNGCQNLLILEDDGIVSRDFYMKIQEALESMKTLEYFALKLFYSDTFAGWSEDLDDVLLLLAVSGFLSLFLGTIPPLVLIFRWRKVAIRPGIILVVYFWVFYALVVLAIGKQSLFPKYQGKGVLKLGRHMGSTVGVVYQAKHFRGLFEFLKDRTREMDESIVEEWDKKYLKPVDLMIDDYADMALNLDTYLLLPNVVQHIGRFSSTNSRNHGSVKVLSLSNSFPKRDEIF